MSQRLLSVAFALVFTSSANAGGLIVDSVFVRAAEQVRQTIKSGGTDQAALLVDQCYREASEREREFGPIHTTCVTQDYLLTAVLASPYDRASWWPPYNRSNRYDILAPALQSRIASIHALLNTPLDIVDDTRRRMFDIAATAFMQDGPNLQQGSNAP